MITNEIFFSNHPHLPTSLNYSQLWKFDVSKKKVENKKADGVFPVGNRRSENWKEAQRGAHFHLFYFR